MNAFVAKAFAACGWGTDAAFLTFIQNKKRRHEKDLAAVKNPKARIAKASQQKEEIIQLRKESRQFRRASKRNSSSECQPSWWGSSTMHPRINSLPVSLTRRTQPGGPRS